MSDSESEHKYKFDVKMGCKGCSSAIEKALRDVEGVSSLDVSLEKQEVLVSGTLPYDDVLAKIKTTGREVRSGETLE